MSPRISIVTVTLNGAEHLDQAMQSVISQEYSDLEYILVDGGSTDGTLDIIEQYRKSISHFISEPDRGISDAFNKGIRIAGGEIIGIVSADDYLLPGALKAVAEEYARHGWPDVVHGNCISLNPATGLRFLSRPDSSLKSAFFGQPLKHGSTFVSKAAYQKHGMFDLSYRAAMDYDLILRLIVNGARFAYVNRELAVIRDGGINVRLRSLTRRESREISIRHGCPHWKAEVYMWWKIIKDNAKVWLTRLHLHQVVSVYRRKIGKNVPIQGVP